MLISSSTQTTEVQNTRTSETRSKKTYVQNLEDILRIPLLLSWCFSLIFFSGLRDFYFKSFRLHQRVSPSFIRYFATKWMLKESQRVPLSHFLAHCDPVQKSHVTTFFRKICEVSEWSPAIFFLSSNKLDLPKAQRVPLP